MILLTTTNSTAQLITVLLVFVAVLAVTALVTRWIANYQKAQGAGRNLEIIESMHLGNNKLIEIIRVGDTYKAIAVGKDTVTYLGDVDPSTLKTVNPSENGKGFKSLFDKAMHISKTSHDGEDK